MPRNIAGFGGVEGLVIPDKIAGFGVAVTHYLHLENELVGSDLEKGRERRVSEGKALERNDEEWQKVLHEGEEERMVDEAE